MPQLNPFSQNRSLEGLFDDSEPSTLAIRRFFNQVYAWMCVGLALTGLVAYYVGSQPDMVHSLLGQYGMGGVLGLMVAEIALAFTIMYAVKSINATAATVLFLIYSALTGLSLSVLFMVYTQASITAAFGVTSGIFLVMSILGFTTSVDLSRFRTLAIMLLGGIILATVVNFWMQSSGLYWLITYGAVIIFTGLIAFDTQILRRIAVQTENDPQQANRYAIVGSLFLYLDFINLFIYLLRIIGKERR